MAEESQLIAMEQVQIGMFIKLDLSWFEHSFPMNSFKITNQQQIRDLHALKLKHVRFFPSKSDIRVAKPGTEQAVEEKDEVRGVVYDNIIEAKKARFEKLMAQRDEIARCEEKFVHAASVVKI